MDEPSLHDENQALKQAALERDQLIRYYVARTIDSETRLNAVYGSLSWRLTGPLRGLAARHPALRRLLRRPSPAPPPDEPEAAPEPPPSTKPIPAAARRQPAPPPAPAPDTPPRTWFFLEDTIEWLQAHAHLSGVGKVTAELFFASLGLPADQAFTPCRLQAGRLVSVSTRDAVAFLAPRAGLRSTAELLEALPPVQAPPSPSVFPRSGDHVLFTGMAWTPRETALMQALRQDGIRFSVLVYDIIPIEHPGFVSPAHATMFTEWLGTLVTEATALFVSSAAVGNDILRWAMLSGHRLAATVVPVTFGSGSLPPAAPAPSAAAPFVLSVGTVDPRKNQALLCRVWVDLVRELGSATPHLVLVGRDDIGLATLSPPVAALVEAGVIQVRDDVGDAELAGLYRDCLLTVFPSLAEGHGLPVAESLAHGKLCICSDLPVIRAHAGDLPWFHPPGDEAAVLALLRHALLDPARRRAAEASVRERHRSFSWSTTVAGMLDALQAPAGAVAAGPAAGAVVAPLQAGPALAAARAWCTGEEPEVSILIVNRDAAEAVRDCIRHVWAHTVGTRYEVIVIDNGSGADDLRLLAGLGSGVRLVALETDRYLGEARNIGAEAAAGLYLCLLDARVRVGPGWLGPLLRSLTTAPGEAAAAGPSAGASGPVERLPATTLLVERAAFLAVNGFDLSYEPGGFEDDDLCFKLRALGRTVIACPAVPVAAVADRAAEARHDAVLALNQTKFAARWSNPAHRVPAQRPAARLVRPARTAALWTPYALTPGGGERFLLTLASVLATDHQVTIVTPHRYSRMRLRSLGLTFGINMDDCDTTTDAEFQNSNPPGLMVTLGNEVTPGTPARSANSLFICQFPFPVPVPDAGKAQAIAGGYRAYIAYSSYVKAHITADLARQGFAPTPIEVVYPPVPSFQGDAAAKRPMILSVGRFIAGGHSKRHDAMIDAFKRLYDRVGGGIELHLAGSSHPSPEHLAHLAQLRQAGEGYPVVFHVNAPATEIEALYKDAMIYWHAAGFGADLVANPGLAEHFGISVVEAMSAQCIPVAFKGGGPAEIITPGVDGFLFETGAELVDLTERLMRPGSAAERDTVGRAAESCAGQFSAGSFAARIRQVVSM